MSGSLPVAPGELHPERPVVSRLQRHLLILDGSVSPKLTEASLDAMVGEGGRKCLHVLSSFQRTGLACRAVTPQRRNRRGLFRALPLRLFRRQGNLSILLTASSAVNPFRRLTSNITHDIGPCRAVCGVELEAVTAATGRRQVTLGSLNIGADTRGVNLDGENRRQSHRGRSFGS
jgi:hypothetical protein